MSKRPSAEAGDEWEVRAREILDSHTPGECFESHLAAAIDAAVQAERERLKEHDLRAMIRQVEDAYPHHHVKLIKDAEDGVGCWWVFVHPPHSSVVEKAHAYGDPNEAVLRVLDAMRLRNDQGGDHG